MGRFLYQFNSCVLSAIKAILSANVPSILCSLSPFYANAFLLLVLRWRIWRRGPSLVLRAGRLEVVSELVAMDSSWHPLAQGNAELPFPPGRTWVENQVSGGHRGNGRLPWPCGGPTTTGRFKSSLETHCSSHSRPFGKLSLSPHNIHQEPAWALCPPHHAHSNSSLLPMSPTQLRPMSLSQAPPKG